MRKAITGKKYLLLAFTALTLTACNEDYVKASLKLSTDGAKVFQDTGTYFGEVITSLNEHCRITGLGRAISGEAADELKKWETDCEEGNKPVIGILAAYKTTADSLSASYKKLGTISGNDQVEAIQQDLKNVNSALESKIKEVGTEKYKTATTALGSAIGRVIQAKGIKDFTAVIDGVPAALAFVLEDEESSKALDSCFTTYASSKIRTSKSLAKYNLSASPGVEALRKYMSSVGITPADKIQASTGINNFADIYVNTEKEQVATVSKARITLAGSIKEIAETTSKLAKGAEVTPGIAVENAKEAINIIKDFVAGVKSSS